MRGLSLVAASGGHSSSRCAGLSLSWPLLLRSTGSRCTGSVVVAHGPSCPVACGIFPDQGSNPCPVHWQADSQPLHHQGSPIINILTTVESAVITSFSFLIFWWYVFSHFSWSVLFGVWQFCDLFKDSSFAFVNTLYCLFSILLISALSLLFLYFYFEITFSYLCSFLK